jgi:hypothetical protein
MAYDRRSDRRGGGRPSGGRPDRPPRERGGFERERGGFERGGFERGGFERGGYGGQGRDRQRGGFRPRDDEGGMSIRLDPRRLAALKSIAAEAGMRPGELVTSWVEERLDAQRTGKAASPAGASAAALAELTARVDDLARRLDELSDGAGATAAQLSAPPGAEAEPAVTRRPRGRPPKIPTEVPPATPAVPARTPPLHEEIATVIRERGPSTAAEIAAAIAERGRYAAPRSARPLDAATINSRVSNPAYRSRFVREGRRIGLAETG